jgi:hypothetical protein
MPMVIIKVIYKHYVPWEMTPIPGRNLATEILLKVALSTIKPTYQNVDFLIDARL